MFDDRNVIMSLCYVILIMMCLTTSVRNKLKLSTLFHLLVIKIIISYLTWNFNIIKIKLNL